MSIVPDSPAPARFRAVLRPHRSLGPRGFALLMGAVAAVSFIAGLGFFIAGAWPVVGFLGLDVLAIWWAFRLNYSRARMRETVLLTDVALTVERVLPSGETRRWTMQPAWLRVEVDGADGFARPGGAVRLVTHGRALAIGAFLGPGARAALARELDAALADLRAMRGSAGYGGAGRGAV